MSARETKEKLRELGAVTRIDVTIICPFCKAEFKLPRALEEAYEHVLLCVTRAVREQP